MEKMYQLVCYANYCGWKSEPADYETVNRIEKCPRCRELPGPKLRIEEAE